MRPRLPEPDVIALAILIMVVAAVTVILGNAFYVFFN